MAKKSSKRLGRYEKKQSGCMWSLISIFDFRQGPSSQKLLADKKRGSKRIVGTSYPNITLELLSDACETCKEINDAAQSETSTTDSSKMSVKKLMEEDMVGEQDQKKHASNDTNRDEKKTDEIHAKKNRRWSRSKTSFDLETDDFIATEDLVAKNPTHRKHKSLSSVDLNIMVEELCNRIHPKDISCLKHGEDEDPCVIEDKLGEATKILVNCLTDRKNLTKDGKVQPSKELLDALEILNSNKEVFMKLLQDPNSELVKQVESLQDIQVEEGKFKVFTGSNWLEQSFFWRRFKGKERNQSKKSDNEDLNRIVILKPGPPCSRNSDMGPTCSSLPESPKSVEDRKGQIERVSSSFSFSEFKRKLKHAMKKEQHDVVCDGISHQSSNKRVGGESVGMASPNRDHFFIERLPKSSIGNKNSKIYVEAKKHLAEVVGNSDVDLETQVPKSLGRILSYSGYTSPTICSPRQQGGHVIQEINVNLSDQMKQDSESELCLATDETIHETEVSKLEPRVSDGLPCESGVDEPTVEPEVPNSEVDGDIDRSHDAEVQKDSCLTGSSFEPCAQQFITSSGQLDSPSKCSEENSGSTQTMCEEHDSSFSPTASTLTCSVTEKIEDLSAVSDATSRPSPISVLEPLFKDDISPPCIKSAAVKPIQPRQIRFEEEISERVPYNRTCIEDDKYTFDFVKAVLQMSGLTWDELLRRYLLSDHLIDPSLLDEVDFLPDLLSCDFYLLFDLINEILIDICGMDFIPFAKSSIHPELKGKDIVNEIWKVVDWYLKLEGPPRTLEQIVAKDLAKSRTWMELLHDSQIIGIQLQEAILEELLEDSILNIEFLALPSQAKGSEISVEL